MQHKLISIILLILGITGTLSAQEDPIFTDRPNVTDAVAVLPKGVFQVEVGYLNDKTTFDVGSITFSTMPNLSFKYGLSESIELRVLTNYAARKIKNDVNTVKATGFTALTLSPKFALLDQLGAIPKTSFVANFTLPDVGAEEFRIVELNYGFRALFEYNFGKVTWTNSFGNDWLDFDNTQFTITTVLGLSVTDKLGSFVEFYNISSTGSNTFDMDFGLTYLLSNKIQLDAIYGFNLYNREPSIDSRTIFGFGFAWKTGK